MYLSNKDTLKKKINKGYLMFMQFFSDFLYKIICCGYSFVGTQIGTHSIHVCFYTEMDKKYTGCNLKTTELLDCTLIGICAVIRLNTILTTYVLMRNK